uniref:FBO_C domain-containing protein n=1 Tax=Steinernema glaseri TaxID=37863 RepID=A0A1I7Y7Q4_9BILA
MYLQVPHLHFFGVYVAKVTYLRHGESSFQDKFYRPWHMVTYYRILRFFADGSVLMLTSPEHPSTLVANLKNRRDAKSCEGILFGRYWNNGSSISMKLSQKISRKKARQHQVLNSKRLRGVVAPHELIEKNFFLELKFSERRGQANKFHGVLLWSKYEYSHVLVDGSLSKGDFHVVGDSQSYPPFHFSRVKSFAAPEGFDEVLC